MNNSIHRRDFLKTSAAMGAGIGLLNLAAAGLPAAPLAKGAPNAEKLGWRLACQAYSFNRFTFYEAIDKTASLGLHYIEAYPKQKLSKDRPNVTVAAMPAEVRKEVKQKLADSGVKLVAFGVDGYTREIFDFAKDMGIETLVCEPAFDDFDTLDKLVELYGINAALHNHPAPSRYWNPDTVLKVTAGRSKRIGACADTGHWMRSGINPIEAIKKLEGRIITFHLKDLNQMGKAEAEKGKEKTVHDVPWGTGVGDVRGMLTEIRRQGIKAVFSIEYEYNWENSLPEIAQCVEYFDKVAAELAATG